ncbi:RTX iron-regulated FrpC family protein [Neisseria shayeganii]|uniref:Uncharacterized protein n=1 Tax=Neisseria shayeganii TaxID=607712 RepID=A0A7D7NCC0_9NEIS|nr:RTX iron-regulated FrpC family protein [Neisseria shayeganii]QMT40976.1 hypothetical protein H3L94_02680 [Neisseria shayeganii]
MKIKLKLLYLWMCSVFLLNACFQGETEMKQKQEVDVPVSGYEHTVRFDVAGVHLDVPYGYLYEYSNKVKQMWLQNNDNRHEIEPLRLMVAEMETLSPYNQKTQHHFKNHDNGTGSDAVSMLIYSGEKCKNLNSLERMKESLNHGYTYMSGLPSGYIGFENNSNPTRSKDIYFEDENEKTILGIRKEDHNGKFVVQAFSCRNNLYVHYYLDYEPGNEFPINDAIQFNQRLNQLIESMIVN